MSEHPDDVILNETLERIRRAELASVLHPPGTPEHTRAVERLDRATRQMHRLEDATTAADGTAEAPGTTTGQPGG